MMDALRSEFTQVQHLMEDEEEKKSVVLEAVRAKCKSVLTDENNSGDDRMRDLLRMGEVLESGTGTLQAELIAGGKTNFSFNVFIHRHDDKGEDAATKLAIYAKLYLTYAIWDTKQSFEFGLHRATNEYSVVQKLDQNNQESNNNMPGSLKKFPVVTPYCLLDLEVNVNVDGAEDGGDQGKEKAQAKLLLGQWATDTEEQWANQFIDGEVDTRVIPTVAKALAFLNAPQPFLQLTDQNWNDDSARQALVKIGSTVKLQYTSLTLLPDEECDVLMRFLKTNVKQSLFDTVVDEYCSELNERKESLCHGDCHPFNLLVEPKRYSTAGVIDSSAPTDEKTFGPLGSVVMCDWETAILGPRGRDAGIFMAYPTACALCFAVQGYEAEALHLVDCATMFWDLYAEQTQLQWSEQLKAAGSDDEATVPDDATICRIYKVAMGSMGGFLLFHLYMLGLLMDTLPLEGVSNEEAQMARGAMGVVGMKALLFGFDEMPPTQIGAKEDNSTTSDDLKSFYPNTMRQQIEELISAAASGIKDSSGGLPRSRRKKVSFLRSFQRKISDASTLEEAAKRLSIHGLDQACHKRASALDSSDLGNSMGSFIDDDEDDDYPVTEEMKMQWADD